MKKLIHLLTLKINYIIVIIYAAIQLVLIFTVEVDYNSDALYYYDLAQKCIDQNVFYPAQQNLYDDYIVAPLYINIIFMILKIYNSTVAIGLFNLIVILLQIYVLYKITQKLFSEDVARITILLFILYLNTIALMLQNYTELFFLLLVSYSIYFFILQKNTYLLLSGILAGCAIAVRPVGWALLFAFLIIHFISIYKSKKISISYFYVYSGAVVFIITFGIFTKMNFQHFEFASTTGPINLLLGANDDATGGFNSTVLEKGKAGYIEFTDSLTYLQKDEFYKRQVVNWITENPGLWLLLAPMKLIHTFAWDDISLSSLLGMGNTNFARVMKVILLEFDFDKALPNTSLSYKVVYLSILILHHLFYYFMIVAIILGLYNLFRNKLYSEKVIVILIFSLISIIMIMLTVGTPRYKYPMFILLLPFASYYLSTKFRIGEQNFGKK